MVLCMGVRRWRESRGRLKRLKNTKKVKVFVFMAIKVDGGFGFGGFVGFGGKCVVLLWLVWMY